jgi:hypothetical protein
MSTKQKNSFSKKLFKVKSATNVITTIKAIISVTFKKHSQKAKKILIIFVAVIGIK